MTQEELEQALSGKQDALTAGNGLTIRDNEILANCPTVPITLEEYNALPEEEKNRTDLVYAVTDDNGTGGGIRYGGEIIADVGGGGTSGTVNWEDINGRPDLSAVSSMKVQPATLLPEVWFNNRQIISVPDVLADEAQQLIVPVPAQASKAAYLASGIKGISQAAGKLTFQCSTVPTESISLNIYILGAAEIKQEAAGKFVWWSPKMTGPEAPEPYKASASSSYDNNLVPYKAFDGQPSTDGFGTGGMWTSADHAKAAYIQFDFGRRMFIKGLRIDPAYSIYGISTPKWFYVSGSDDGTNWNEIAAYSNVEWASMGEYSEFVLEEPVIYRFYRIGASNVQSSDSFNGRVGYGDIQFSIPEAYDVNS